MQRALQAIDRAIAESPARYTDERNEHGDRVARQPKWVAQAREAATATAAQLADLRRALRAYDLAGPLTETRRQVLGEILTLARQLTEE